MEHFRRYQFILPIIILYSGLAFANSGGALKNDCPSNEGKFWSFINASVKKISRHQDTVDSKFLTTVAKRIESCVPKNSQAAACTSNLLKFSIAAALKQGPGHRYGFIPSDKDYLADKKVKSMVALPEELKNGLPKDWKSLAQHKGWKYIEFGSSMVGAFPFNSHRRLVFLIESEAKDLWIMYTAPESLKIWSPWVQGAAVGLSIAMNPSNPDIKAAVQATTFSEKLIDIISVEKQRPSDKGQPRSRVYYAEMLRDFLGGKNPRLHAGVSSCYECHANGMRNIVPALGTMAPDQKETLRLFNEKMDSYGKMDWSGMVNKEHLGPPIGRTQSCIGCHNNLNDEDLSGRSRGELNYFANADHIRGKIVDMAHMPIGAMDGEKFRALRESLAVMDTLNATERAEHQKNISFPIRLNSTEGNLVPRPSLYRHRTEYEVALEFLRKKQKITDSKHSLAMNQLTELRKKQTLVYNKLMEAYAKDLSAWLLPKEHCGEQKSP